MIFECRPDLESLFSASGDPFAVVASLEGERYRDMPGRRTLRFDYGGRSYFLKFHYGVGWREIFKNLLTLRPPVLGAGNEYAAIRRLEALGVDTLSIAAFARAGFNPARQRSFIITDELPSALTLEDLCRDWSSRPPPLRAKRHLIRQVARISRILHGNGINHRDYYLCHFHIDEASFGREHPTLWLIDLHRAQLRSSTPYRWRLKDVAGLYFSALDIGLTRGDRLAFMAEYSGLSARETLCRQGRFWERVDSKARRLYRRERRRRP